LAPFGEPTLAGGERAVERAVQDDAEHRVDGTMREPLGGRGDVAGGVVDEDVYAAAVAPDAVHQRVHGSGITDVAGNRDDRAAALGHHFARGVLEYLLAATADDHGCV